MEILYTVSLPMLLTNGCKVWLHHYCEISNTLQSQPMLLPNSVCGLACPSQNCEVDILTTGSVLMSRVVVMSMFFGRAQRHRNQQFFFVIRMGEVHARMFQQLLDISYSRTAFEFTLYQVIVFFITLGLKVKLLHKSITCFSLVYYSSLLIVFFVLFPDVG